MAHHNRRTPILVSTIDPFKVSLRSGERYQVACPWCDRWRLLVRGMVEAHRRGDGLGRCPGSGQRVRLDESERQWRARQDRARRQMKASHHPMAAVAHELRQRERAVR